jgi:hypothetical protein
MKIHGFMSVIVKYKNRIKSGNDIFELSEDEVYQNIILNEI